MMSVEERNEKRRKEKRRREERRTDIVESMGRREEILKVNSGEILGQYRDREIRL
jgi:hypothetical protein